MLNATPTVADCGVVIGVAVNTGATLAGTTFSVKPELTVKPSGSVTRTATVYGLPTVVDGVPVITPVVVFMLKLAGSPVAEYVSELGVSASVKAVAVLSVNGELTVAVCGLVMPPAVTVGAVLMIVAVTDKSSIARLWSVSKISKPGSASLTSVHRSNTYSLTASGVLNVTVPERAALLADALPSRAPAFPLFFKLLKSRAVTAVAVAPTTSPTSKAKALRTENDEPGLIYSKVSFCIPPSPSLYHCSPV